MEGYSNSEGIQRGSNAAQKDLLCWLEATGT